jgi:hypothetical protein
MEEPGDDNASLTARAGTMFQRFSTYVANALRYWEPRRVIYNAVMAVVVIFHVILAWPSTREKLTSDVVLSLFILAVLANVAYCAVYVVDLFVQFSGLDTEWRRGRVVLLIVGTAFAATLAHFFTKALM